MCSRQMMTVVLGADTVGGALPQVERSFVVVAPILSVAVVVEGSISGTY